MKVHAFLLPYLAFAQEVADVSTDLEDIEEGNFEGDFDDGFDINILLEQSESPLAKELLDVDEEGTMGFRGWFDTDAQREDRRKKKLKQMLKMIFFLQADRSPHMLEKYLHYGCYCFPEGHNKLFMGIGDPVDSVDKVCRQMQKCYQCVSIDHGAEDCINSKGYKFKGIHDPVTGRRAIKCTNKERKQCKRSQCECDRRMAEELAEHEMLWNPEFKGGNYGLFDSSSTCKKGEQRNVELGRVVRNECCGEYPDRTMFAADGPNGVRNCCGSKTYDPMILECCDGDQLMSLGFCPY